MSGKKRRNDLEGSRIPGISVFGELFRHAMLHLYRYRRRKAKRGLDVDETRTVKAVDMIVRTLPARAIPFDLGD